MSMVITDGDDVKRVVADFADLLVLVVHEVNEVGRRLCLLDDHLTGRLVEDHLIEDVRDLQDHLIILLLCCNTVHNCNYQKRHHDRFSHFRTIRMSCGLVKII